MDLGMSYEAEFDNRLGSFCLRISLDVVGRMRSSVAENGQLLAELSL